MAAMEGAYYSALPPDPLVDAEEGRQRDRASEKRGRGNRVMLLVALGVVAIVGCIATLFAINAPGVATWLLHQELLVLGDDHPPQPGEASDYYDPEPCVPRRVPVPRIEDMTLEEKIGQMTQVDQLAVGNGSDITRWAIGSVLSGGGGAPCWGNEPKHWADLVDNMQAKAAKTRLQIPMLYGVDAVHGHNNVQGTTIFPHHVGLGATRNPELVKAIGAAAAREVAATGIRWAFAPTVAVCRDPRWGRCYESFSEQTHVVQAMTAEIDGWQTKAMNKSDPAYILPGDYLVAGSAKHFVGDGGTYGGKDEGDTEVSEEELRAVHLPPFKDAVDRDVLTVMISYSSWNGLKMHANKYLVTDVLKGELGFNGVVVSDWAAIQQIPGDWNYQVRTSINAGLDMIMVPTTYQAFIVALKEEVLAGRVSMSRIDDAVRKILDLKVKLGLFENACAQRSLMKTIGSSEHREIARKAVRESLTLLKNKKRSSSGTSMFPLKLDGAKILVAGTHANNIGLQCGGWTIKWQGGYGNITTGTTVLDGIKEVAKGRAKVEYVEYPSGRESADYGIVAVGEWPYTEYYGDDQLLQLADSSRQAILNVCNNMPCVVLFISGRAIRIDEVLPKVDAFVAAWLPGSEAGKGIADALFSPDFDFTGRLPVTWFPNPAGNRIGDNSAQAPLFPFGFGLDKKGRSLPAISL